jgi:hypothetical protein
MALDATSQSALVIIAVAVSVQAVLFVMVVIAGVMAWKRTQAVLDERLAAVTARLDLVADQTRRAAESVEAISGQARDAFQSAGNVVKSVASAVTTPKTYLVTTAASALSGVLSRWRRRKSAPISNVNRIQSIN